MSNVLDIIQDIEDTISERKEAGIFTSTEIEHMAEAVKGILLDNYYWDVIRDVIDSRLKEKVENLTIPPEETTFLYEADLAIKRIEHEDLAFSVKPIFFITKNRLDDRIHMTLSQEEFIKLLEEFPNKKIYLY